MSALVDAPPAPAATGGQPWTHNWLRAVGFQAAAATNVYVLPSGGSSPAVTLVGDRWFVYGQFVPAVLWPKTRADVAWLAGKAGFPLREV